MSQNEDGEGSAASSESSEAKTDRYGFLLGNGDAACTSSSDEPCPELVRHREMKWLSLMNHWDQAVEKKNSKVKTQCQKGIPASVRSKCWPLLCGAAQRKEKNRGLYQGLESAPGRQSWIDVIKRDTDRQFPFHEMFQSKDGHGQQGLLNVLKVYTQFRPDEGYCQAQGPVAAVLLMNMPMEEAFWCLVQISELYLPGYYSPLLEGVLFDAAVLSGVLKRACPAAYKHMQRQGVEPLMFATDWLMCLYSRHLPFNTLLRVWDLFFCYGVRVLFQVAVVLVRRCLGDGRLRKECEGQMETLERLRGVRGRVQHEQSDTFVQEVCSVPLSLSELQRLTDKQFEKWKTEHPGSTFDPRGRCHGYHMVWEKAKEKQSRNLTAPVVRSHSSLSPAILRKKWRKQGSKAEAEEWEGSGRSCSQGGRDDADDGERRRASVCVTAEELRDKTDRTLQEFSKGFQKDDNTLANPRCKAPAQRTSSELSDHSAPVFEEDEDDLVDDPSQHATSTNSEAESEEAKSSSGPAEEDSQTGMSQHEVEPETSLGPSQDGPQILQDEQNQNEDVQTDEEIPREHKEPDSSQEEMQQNGREPDQETEVDVCNLEEQADVVVNTCGPEDEVMITLSIHDEDVEVCNRQEGVEEQVELISWRRVEEETQINEISKEKDKRQDDQETETDVEAQEPEEEAETGTESCEHDEKAKCNPCQQEPEEEPELNSTRFEGKDIDSIEEEQESQTVISEPGDGKERDMSGMKNDQDKPESKDDEDDVQKRATERVDMQEDTEHKQDVQNISEICDTKEETDLQQEEGQPQIHPDPEAVMETDHEKVDVHVTPSNTDGEIVKDEQEAPANEVSVTDSGHKDTSTSVPAPDPTKTDPKTEQPGKSESGHDTAEADQLEEENSATVSAPEVQSGNCKPEELPSDSTSEPVGPEPPEPQAADMSKEKDDLTCASVQSNSAKPASTGSSSNAHPNLRLRRSSSSHSYPTILSEDTFKIPQHITSTGPTPEPDPEPATIKQSRQTSQPPPAHQTKTQTKVDKPKRRGLFHRLRSDAPPKTPVPKILIQDFSEGEEKLSSKERRRRRREQERKEKEEEKERKRRDKELEKEREKERKKIQTRGRSFQMLARKHEDDDSGSSGRSSSQALVSKRNSVPYSESYF